MLFYLNENIYFWKDSGKRNTSELRYVSVHKLTAVGHKLRPEVQSEYVLLENHQKAQDHILKNPNQLNKNI